MLTIKKFNRRFVLKLEDSTRIEIKPNTLYDDEKFRHGDGAELHISAGRISYEIELSHVEFETFLEMLHLFQSRRSSGEEA